MASRDKSSRKRSDTADCTGEPAKKRLSKREREQLICKKRLDALDAEESFTNNDRLTAEERSRLVDAYNEHGFHVFQNSELLSTYLPKRRKADVKSLIDRHRSCVTGATAASVSSPGPEAAGGSAVVLAAGSSAERLDSWQLLCGQMLGKFAKDRKTNLDDVLSDALHVEAARMEGSAAAAAAAAAGPEAEPNYAELVRDFGELLARRFPSRSTGAANAQVSMQLFEHVCAMADGLAEEELRAVAACGWLAGAGELRRRRQRRALEGLAEAAAGVAKKCPSALQLERSEAAQALCLELPKIRRIIDVLNPLQFDELLLGKLMAGSPSGRQSGREEQ